MTGGRGASPHPWTSDSCPCARVFATARSLVAADLNLMDGTNPPGLAFVASLWTRRKLYVTALDRRGRRGCGPVDTSPAGCSQADEGPFPDPYR